MKTPSDELFRIIKSLSRSEKRYFKVVSASQEGSKVSQYAQLFDAIDAMESYDEEALIQKNEDQTFVKNLSMSKKYLQESILKSLCAYHAGIGIENDINEKVQAAQILYEKGLVPISSKLLKKARGLARKYEKHGLLLHVSQMEGTHSFPLDPENFIEFTDELYSEQLSALEVMRLDTEYYRLMNISLTYLKRMMFSRTQEDVNALRSFLEHPLLKDPAIPQTVGQRTFQSGILSRCHFILGDYEQAYKYAKLNIDAWEELPHKIEEHPLRYAKTVKNFAIRCLKAQRYDDVYAVVQKFRSLPDTDQRIRNFKFQALYTLELTYYQETGEYEKALALIPEIEKEFEAVGLNVKSVQRVIVLHNVMQVCFYAGEYNLAIDYAARTLNEGEALPDLYGFTKIVVALLHYDIGNVNAFESALRSAQRYLKNRGRLLQFEELFLKCLKKIIGIAERSELHEYCRESKERLLEILQDPKEARALEYFDFIAWLESKIENRPLREVLLQKVREREESKTDSSRVVE